MIFIEENEFENIVNKVSTIPFRLQCIKSMA